MRPAKNFIDVLGFFMEQAPGAPGGKDYNSDFCQLLAAAASAEAASIWNLDPSGNLRLAYGTNVDPMEADGFFLHQGEGISGAVAMTQKTIAVAQAFSNRQHSRRLDELIGYQTRSMISSPILYRGMLYGVVNILNYRFNKAFPTQWAERMTSLGILYAQALALAGKSVPSEPGEAHQNIKKNCVPGSHTTTVVGISPKIQNVLNLAFKAGRTDVPVLIYGETGTGKELTARRIHEANLKPKRPFSAINCAALTESILESELFGHVKGAFSGAVNHRKGKFAAASGGTSAI